MKLSPIFKINEQASEGLLRLLESVTLGTNGAKYKHLDTRNRIGEADAPLHITVERRDQVLGNASFCRRNTNWYVRYFAFNPMLQAKGTQKSKARSGRLKQELSSYFDHVLNEGNAFGEPELFYAYIDPNNEKSLWMSENFGFETIAQIATQTFSRVNLSKSTRVQRTNDWEKVAPILRKAYDSHQFYFETQLKKGPFYTIQNQSGEILACAKAIKAQWKIERLPGKFGGVLTKVVPFIPGLRRIIRPDDHRFLVPEAVWVQNNDPQLLNELFEGMLSMENHHLMLWWTDEKNPLYAMVKNQMKWGLLDRAVGVHNAAVVAKFAEGRNADKSTPVYTCGFDFV